MTSDNSIATHPEPAWRERSDFIFRAPIKDWGHLKFEQLWGRKIDAVHFEICCIPFFVRNVSLGDVVRTGKDLRMTSVTAPSGRSTFRVWFGQKHGAKELVANTLRDMGCLIEWSPLNLMAIDARDDSLAAAVVQLLAERESKGELEYETGRTD